ncbi:D-alanyl-D-alanine dipeptidase [Candidatus Peregrinibacteria bacterium CG22_combo_CG10-13_8_21_14_all_44_10]|nr:MAG: hypothetical protein AUK45_01050 [Candidatus Peregrinibacteria bacterium CG2_30_44_17]PIP65862.1 MAG: D-alanyl-D-alanine dipeptidase [Candidatus Peregrinibacteria bacterium CG22_combo_CG10-13_8_21_14_all_44_10]PIS03587.1 MAG: D-alanyl-D-alanine dipeptidase [Candidatus Peregrinibacteria bacterium CG10_big_fil_rev_8_21_14_0_10_44_7]PIX80618.1 MAG: D-alanyl-D-alanine dipeptidase [Candidatus Peregrinibacteria bacterium CG_4_10_14_3_um_filter_44_21]PJB88609.1 MAG: D-alanyl-D-alanine dipeptid
MTLFELNDEELRDPRDFGFLIEPLYYKQGLTDRDNVLVREGVLKRLQTARSRLPEGLNFKIWDGYRDLRTQTVLYVGLYKKIIRRRPLLTYKEAQKEVEKFVARPSFAFERPSPHNTGAAVDLTLVDRNGQELDMGTFFDHFDIESYTKHFEDSSEGSKEYKWHMNRMILYSVLIGEGFFNFPDEWWHYSYGDVFWADEFEEKALYGSAEI